MTPPVARQVMASTQAIMGIDGTNEGQRRIRQLKINTRLVHSPDFTHFSITIQPPVLDFKAVLYLKLPFALSMSVFIIEFLAAT